MSLLISKLKPMASRWSAVAYMTLAILAAFAVIAGSSEAAGKRGGVLRMTMSTDLTQIDLHQTSAEINNVVMGMRVYETLFAHDGKNNIKPFLVESYQFSNDGLLMTMNLKKGVKFHNGAEMTAEDVKFSLDRVRSPELPGFHVNNLKKVTEVKITGPYRVQLVLSAKMANLLNYLATDVGTIAIMNKKDLEANGNKVVKPIGTGPYKWVEWVKDSKVVFERFDGYSSADGPVDGMLGKRHQYFDRLEFYVMKEPSTRIMALDKGDVEFTSTLPYHMISDLKKRDDLTVYSALPPGCRLVYVLRQLQPPYPGRRKFSQGHGLCPGSGGDHPGSRLGQRNPHVFGDLAQTAGVHPGSGEDGAQL